MSVFIKNNKMLSALRICGILTNVWPLEDGVGRVQVIFYKALSCIYLVNDFSTMPALILGMSYYQNNFSDVLKAIMEMVYVLEMIACICYCKAKENVFRKLLAELKRPDNKCGSPYEEIVRREFMFYVRVIYICGTIMYLMCAVTFIFSPLILSDREIPLNTVFPFSISENWVWYLVYMLNVLIVWQSLTVLQFDMILATVLLNASFKFNLVAMQMRSVFTVANLRTAINAHQNVLNYAGEIRSISGFLIIKSLIVVFVNTINCSLLIINDASLWEVIQFFSVVFVSLLRLYIVCWTAELMTYMANTVSWAIYDIPWIQTTSRVRQDVLMIIQRCQKSVMIKAIIPTISIQFFGKIVSMGFSYILTLQTILGDRI